MIFTKNSVLGALIQSRAWFRAFWISTVSAVVIYLANALFFEVNPGNAWGLSYGSVALALMMGAALYGIRRRHMRALGYPLVGSSFHWVQYHVYGGTLFLLLMFMHIGFRLPAGPLNWGLWLMSIWVTLSGVLGIVLQKWIPRMLTSGLSVEAIYERIPELVDDIRQRCDVLIQTAAEPVRNLYATELEPVLAAPRTRLIYYFDITGGIRSQVKSFDYLRKVLSTEASAELETLETMYRTKLELDAHYTLQKALRWWLYTHVPTSIFLLVLVAIHLYAVFYY